MVIVIMAVVTSVGDNDFYDGVDGDTVVVIYTMLRMGIYMMLKW